MRQVRVEFELVSATCIAQRPTAPGQFTETLSYLTGTVIRGALASRWLAGQRYERLSADAKATFQRLFLDHAVTFGNAWPLLEEARDTAWQTCIVPRSAWTRKRTGGWKGDEREGVRDILTTVLRGAAPPADLDGVGQEFVRQRGDRWRSLPSQRRLISRTALTDTDRSLPSVARGTARAGALFSFEALEAGQQFVARLQGADDLIDYIEQHLLQPRTMLGIGQGRSRGLGQMRVMRTRAVEDEDQPVPQLMEWARTFSAWAGAASDVVYLPVTLESDLILRDNYLLPCSSGEPDETLSRYLPGAPPDMHLVEAMQSTRWIGGWDELRRIPRAPQLAVLQGSVWVYSVPLHALEAAITWWLRAMQHGIGDRLSEGFGKVRLLHPMHREERIW